MTGFTQLFTDSFNRANAASWGNGWIDNVSAGSIASDIGDLAAVSTTGYTGAGIVYRPTSDGIPRDGQITITLAAGQNASEGILGAVRLQPSSSAASGYMGGWNLGTNQFVVFAIVNGSVSSTVANVTPSAAYNNSHTYSFSVSAVGVNPTTIQATLTDTTTSTVLATINTTSSTAALQSLSTGVFGVYSYNSASGTPALLTSVTTYAATTAATAVTMTGPTTGAVSTASSNFTINVNGSLASSVTVTPSDGGAGGTFTPASLIFATNTGQPAAQTFTYTPSSTAQTDTISVTNTGSLTNPSSISYVATSGASALTIGTLTATASYTGITLSLSAALAGGTGSGYEYLIYRGTDPNFAANGSSLLATVSSMPYTDTTAVAGTQYYYGVVGLDGGSDTVNAYPGGLGTVTTTFLMYVAAQLQTQPLAVVCIGDSITYGSGVTNAGTVNLPTMPGYLIAKLARLFGIRTVTGSNQGHDGYTTVDFVPTGSTYAAARSAMTTLLTATPSALPVFSIMLGTNDSSQSGADNSPNSSPASPSQFNTSLKAIITQLLTDFSGCKIFVHCPTWYSPNTGATNAVKQQIGLSALVSYLPVIKAIPAAYATSNPGRVFLGDAYAFQWFAQNYNAELQTESGSDGNYRIHPLGTAGADGLIGTQVLGEFHAEAIAQGLYGAPTTNARSYSFS